MEETIGYFLAILVGISLGLVGSGGSILTVPILVYIMGIAPVNATAYSLFIVGTTALVGGLKNALAKNVDFKTAIIFGTPSIISIYLTRVFLVPIIPNPVFSINGILVTKDIFLMTIFAIVMIFASYSMINPQKSDENNSDKAKYNLPFIFIEGIFLGVLTGLVGAGGGFLIIPALVLLARIPMKLAVGTSLIIIAANSLVGFMGSIRSHYLLDYSLMIYFTLASISGMFMGIYLSKKIDGIKLKTGFGWLILVMGIYIIVKELILR